jgi:hypothetical protein
MKRLVLVPEDVYSALCTTRNHPASDPYDKQMEEKSRKMAQILEDPQTNDDNKVQTYEHQLKRIKMLKNARSEAQIENPQVFEGPTPQQMVDNQQNLEPPDHEVIENAQPPQMPAPPPKQRQLRTAQEPTELERRVAQISQQLLQNRHRLAIDKQGRVLDANQVPIQNSRIDRILKRMLNGIVGGRKPNGYDRFYSEIHRQPDLHTLITPINVQRGAGIPTSLRFAPNKWKKR